MPGEEMKLSRMLLELRLHLEWGHPVLQLPVTLSVPVQFRTPVKVKAEEVVEAEKPVDAKER